MTRALRVHAMIDSLSAGGAELLLADFAAVARREGIELSVGYLLGGLAGPGLERLRRIGVQPTHVGIRSLLGPRDLLRVRRHLQGVGPELVHTHLDYADFLGGLAARSLDLPAVSTIHAEHWSGPVRERAKLRLSALARRHCAERVIAVSDGARAAYLREGWDAPDRVVTIHNAISRRPAPGSGAEVRRELGIEPGQVVIGMVSALRREKRHDVVLAAVRELAGRHPSVCLVIAGSGPAERDVRRLAASLADRVRITGFRDDVMQLLDAIDILVQPSATDAFPTSLLEAMTASVPIVATDTGGIPELVEHGSQGLLVPATAGSGTIAATLERLIVDPELRRRLGAGGRRRVTTRFTADCWARRTRELYDAVLRDGRRRGRGVSSRT